ncbi:amidohydrolase family protein [Olivibacter sitiensis]|uniref:amidohydrolase family protein n=1 Tax=Olivibacter sitiensis TaxID=376470 RepID=UPI00040E4E2A|nr:amidohydrolase family protein [Olivibacter sitiensis]
MSIYHTADYIFPVHKDPVRNGIVEVGEDGEILGLYHSSDEIPADAVVQKHKGFITPGFVNSHCHLELSHLLGALPRHTGLVRFLQSVMKFRYYEEDDIVAAMERADAQMLENGVVAVGDISNTAISAPTKKDSAIAYHTFVELLCFEPEKARAYFDRALETCQAFDLPSSITPHAPYSVCKEIYRYLKQLDHPERNLLSIHNQETEEENKFFRYKNGDFVDFYRELGRDISFFKAQGRDSLQSMLPLMPSNQPCMLVHNTYTTIKDIYFVNRHEQQITWCFCPKANLYIENRLPKIPMFWKMEHEIVLGTDSLASNDRLCILSEIKTILQHFDEIPFEKVLRWATLNGAKYLQMDEQLGSLEIGKTPGLNLISHVKGKTLSEKSTVKKLA